MDAACDARLFLALWPDPGVRDALRAWRDGWQWPRGATPVKTQNLHMTLHFLGNVGVARIGELTAALAVPFSRFEIGCGHAALWPHGIAVLEPESVPPQLLALQAALGAVLQRLGIGTDSRAFRPHVTLARRAMAAAPPGAGPPLCWDVRGYALMESRIGADGACHMLHHYETVAKQ